MSPSVISGIVITFVASFWTFILAAAIYFDRLGKPTVHTLLEHQRGILFRRGRSLRELGAGSYKLRAGVDFLLWVDMRPQPVQFERIAFHSSDGSAGFVTLAGSMQVRDVKTAIFRSRHHNSGATAAIFVALRKFMGNSDRARLSGDREKLSEELFEQAKQAGAEFGVELTALHISELNLGGTTDRTVGFTPELARSS